MQFKISLVALVAAMQLEGALANLILPWGLGPQQCPLAGNCSPRLAGWLPCQQHCQQNFPSCTTVTTTVYGPPTCVTSTVPGPTKTVTDTIPGGPTTITSTCTGPPTTITTTSMGPPTTVTKTVTVSNPWQNVNKREVEVEAAAAGFQKRTFWGFGQSQCIDIGFEVEWLGILGRGWGAVQECCNCAFPPTTTTTCVTVPGPTTTSYVTKPATTTTVCVTVPGKTKTVTITVPGGTKTSTCNEPGPTKTVTVTVL